MHTSFCSFLLYQAVLLQSSAQVPLKQLGFLRAFHGHRTLVQGMAFSPDGRFLLTGGLDRDLLLWEVKTGRIVRTFQGHTGNVQCVAFTPDGKMALSGSAYGDTTLRLWDVKSGKEVRQFKGHAPPGVLYAIQVLPSGKHFVSCGYDRTIRFWELKTGRQLRAIQHKTDPRWNTYVGGFSPDGRYAIVGGDGPQTKLLDLLLETEVVSLDAQTVHTSLSANGKYLMTANLKGETTLWEAKTGKKLLEIAERSTISPDGRKGVTLSGRVLELPSGKTLFRIKGMRASHFSPDGRTVIGRGDPKVNGNVVRMWRISPNPEMPR